MDEICSAILGRINELCCVGNFIILEEDELYACFPDGAERTRANLESALRKLKAGGFIELRYDRGDVFCLSPLRKQEKIQEEPATADKRPDMKYWAAGAAVLAAAALAGGFMGGIAAGLIAGLL